MSELEATHQHLLDSLSRQKRGISNLEAEIRNLKNNYEIDKLKYLKIRESLQQACKLTKIGHYHFYVNTGTWSSSQNLNLIFGIRKDYPKDVESWLEIVHPSFREEMFQYLRKEVIEEKNNFNKPYKIIARDTGETKWVHGLGELSMNRDGKVTEMFGTIQDITEQKTVETALVESEKKLSMIANNVHDAIFSKDQYRKYTFINDAAAKMMGKDLDEIIGKTPEEVFEPKTAEKIRQVDNLTFKGTFVDKVEELSIAGQTVYLHTIQSPIYSDEEEIIGVTGIVRDITQLKMAEFALKKREEELSELNNAKDRILSIIAHDLRTPISGIHGSIEILIEKLSTGKHEEAEHTAQMIYQSSDQAISLLNNLLDWAKSQTGKVDFRMEISDIAHLIEEALQTLNPKAEEKDIAIIKAIQPDLSIPVDKNMFKTIVRNLVWNAIKFTDPGGKINIISTTEDHHLNLVVKDNGIGIKQESLNRIFNSNTKQSTFGTLNEKGSGLGLLLCKDFVEKHKGSIEVESEEGNGSTFSVCIPFN